METLTSNNEGILHNMYPDKIYPKIETLWKRNKEDGVIIPGKYSLDEFDNVKRWDISEKIDGTNIRIIYDDTFEDSDAVIKYKGKKEKSQIPQPLWLHLEKTFTMEFFERVFWGAYYVVIFGEGYGPKIQSGGAYRADQGFIGFDIYVDGWWLTQQAVYDTLSNEQIDVVPHLGRGTIPEIVHFLKAMAEADSSSVISRQCLKPMEGIVARSYPLMLFRNGNPLMFKLKCIDYKKLEEKEE